MPFVATGSAHPKALTTAFCQGNGPWDSQRRGGRQKTGVANCPNVVSGCRQQSGSSAIVRCLGGREARTGTTVDRISESVEDEKGPPR